MSLAADVKAIMERSIDEIGETVTLIKPSRTTDEDGKITAIDESDTTSIKVVISNFTQEEKMLAVQGQVDIGDAKIRIKTGDGADFGHIIQRSDGSRYELIKLLNQNEIRGTATTQLWGAKYYPARQTS